MCAIFFRCCYVVFDALGSHRGSLSAGGPAEEYCSRLESQNDAEFVVRMMILLGGVAGQIVSCVFWFMCTACCTCFCARPGYCERISTRFSKGCYHWWGRLVTCCGCGWCDLPGSYPRLASARMKSCELFYDGHMLCCWCCNSHSVVVKIFFSRSSKVGSAAVSQAFPS